MIEMGKVIEVKKDIAIVQVESKRECSSCTMTKFCELTERGKRCIETEKMPGTKVGDKVKIKVAGELLLKGTTLLFLIPAISFIFGAVIGQMVMEGIVFSLILGILFLVVAFLILHFFDKKLAEKKNKPKIIAILSS